jgi:hypothetical protein
VIVGWSTRNRLLLPRPINDRMASRSSQRNWVVVRSSHPRMVRTRSLRTESARHRVDHGTICGRSCANSGHYKPLCACVDRIFVNPNSSHRRPEKIRARRLTRVREPRLSVQRDLPRRGLANPHRRHSSGRRRGFRPGILDTLACTGLTANTSAYGCPKNCTHCYRRSGG